MWEQCGASSFKQIIFYKTDSILNAVYQTQMQWTMKQWSERLNEREKETEKMRETKNREHMKDVKTGKK